MISARQGGCGAVHDRWSQARHSGAGLPTKIPPPRMTGAGGRGDGEDGDLGLVMMGVAKRPAWEPTLEMVKVEPMGKRFESVGSTGWSSATKSGWTAQLPAYRRSYGKSDSACRGTR